MSTTTLEIAQVLNLCVTIKKNKNICQYGNCKTRSSYGTKNSSAEFCATH
jgi:hypothetical protein